MRVLGINHLNIMASAEMIARCRAFYVDVIGLVEGTRPPFRSKGHWLYAGGRPIVHLSETAETRTASKSMLDHIALSCEGLEDFIRRLEDSGVEYRVDRVPLTGTAQLFVRDPAGVGIELNFDSASRG